MQKIIDLISGNFIIFLAIDAAVIILIAVIMIRSKLKKHRIAHYGDKAEEKVSSYIKDNFPRAVLLDHVFLPNGKGLTEIDHILISRWGVFVIETKSHNGKITVDKKEWIQHYKDKIIRFHSPLLQNEVHVKAVRNVLAKNRSTANIQVKGLVVFTSNKVYFSERINGVIRLDQLNMAVKYGTVGPRYRQITAGRRKYLSPQKIEAAKKAVLSARNTDRAKIKYHRKSVGELNKNHI